MFLAIKMPKLHHIDEYDVVRIHRKVGDVVKRGDVFLDVTTDDDVERCVSLYAGGTITEINVAVGACVREDTLLGVLDDGTANL